MTDTLVNAFLQLRQIHKVFDEAESILQNDIGVPVCKANCGQCCEHNLPNWMTIEALFAVSALTGMTKLKKTLSIAEGWLLEKDSNYTLYEGMPRGLASPKLREEWQLLTRSQCPFLGTNKQCTIHFCRSLSCRAYGVTRDASEFCPRPLGKGETAETRRYIQAPEFRQDIEKWKETLKKQNIAWVVSGSLPTVLFRVAKPDKFKQYVEDNKIASAKLIGIEYETNLMWQPQVDALRKGIAGELALARR